MNRKLRLLLAAALLVSACASLAPVDLPDAATPGPSQAAFWEELEVARPGDWFVMLNDGPNALDWRLRAIDSATESIDLQTFLWTFDTAGALVLDHLVDAAERGVRVKMLVDDTFLAGQDELLIELAEHRNIEYRVYNPFKRRSSGFITRQLLNLAEYHRLDHRMHNKAMVVDNRVAIVGGRNLADEYFGLHETANFRDMEVMVGGAVVQNVAAAFDAYWNDQWAFPIEMLSHVKASPADLDAPRQVREQMLHIHEEESTNERQQRWLDAVRRAHGGTPTLFVDEPPRENPAVATEAPVQVANAIVDIFDAAEKEIVIVSAYLIPTPALEGAVERAVRRGVRIRMLTNSIRSNNHLTAYSAYRKHVRALLEAGAEMHEVRVDARDRDIYMLSPVSEKELMLHSKTLLIDDDKSFIGSANLDPRSLRVNTEMGLLINSPTLSAELRDAIDPDFDRANAWQLQIDQQGDIDWVSDTQVLEEQPAASTMQRIEDWFFAHLPIEDEL